LLFTDLTGDGFRDLLTQQHRHRLLFAKNAGTKDLIKTSTASKTHRACNGACSSFYAWKQALLCSAS